MGENRRNGNGEICLPLDVSDEINLALRSCKATSNYDTTKDMKRLGMERSNLCFSSLIWVTIHTNLIMNLLWYGWRENVLPSDCDTYNKLFSDQFIYEIVIYLNRAKSYGWYNTYHLTKAMAEMVIHETRGDIPVLIIRPSVIESCYREPYPGWIQGNR